MGLFDDRVHAYPYRLPVPPDNSKDLARMQWLVNRKLVDSILVGRPIAINDGYVAQVDALREHLSNPDSPLRIMARHGFVKLLRRNPRQKLSKLFDKWAVDHHVDSQIEVARNESQWINLKEQVDEFDRDVAVGGGKIKWPNRDKDQAFNLLMLKTFERQLVFPAILRYWPDLYRSISRKFTRYVNAPDRFQDDDGKIPPPRTMWERLIKQHFRQLGSNYATQPATRALMALANVVYHVSFAACCYADGIRVEVETLYSPGHLADYFRPAPDYVVERPEIPGILIPSSLDMCDPKRLKDMLQDKELAHCKGLYLDTSSGYFSGECSFDDVKSAANEYNKALRRFYTKAERQGLRELLDITWDVTVESLAAYWAATEWPEAKKPIICLYVGKVGFRVVRQVFSAAFRRLTSGSRVVRPAGHAGDGLFALALAPRGDAFEGLAKQIRPFRQSP